ncbi:MAG: hypothetical protein JST89_07095 [Cyanobacteria bacterium SZAS-4]|nr:hypothetical protein [Cyanobacteria bacterium SZAS-4]
MMIEKNATMRNTKGSMLLELMCAIVVSGILAISLCQSLSQTKEASFGAHGRVTCAAVAEAIGDRLHATPYAELPAPNSGVAYSVPIYSDDAPITALYSFQVRPIMIEVPPASFAWNTATLANRFPMTAQVTFKTGPFPFSEYAVITVSSTVSPANYVVTTLISQHGIQEE